LENQDKLGGGRVFFSNLDVRILKKFKNKFLFACILTLLPIVKLALGHSRKDPHSPHGGNFCRPEREGRKNCL
jgi:hypothetical protein